MSIVSDHPHAVAPAARPRSEVLLPPAIILLVFAMVVIAVGDRSKIEMPLKELGLGTVETWSADGKPEK